MKKYIIMATDVYAADPGDYVKYEDVKKLAGLIQDEIDAIDVALEVDTNASPILRHISKSLKKVIEGV